jgi:hypothetical protein
MYANLDVAGFHKAITLDSAKGHVRIGRDSNGELDYICIWNTDTPGCIDFEFFVGQSWRWRADWHLMLPGFEHMIFVRRGRKRKHKIQPHMLYGRT